MNWPQHSLGGVAAGSVFASICSVDSSSLLLKVPPYMAIPIAISIIPVAVFGASLPDIDKAGSHISNRHQIISALIRPISKHRGATHSFLALFCIFLLAYLSKIYFWHQSQYLALASQMYFLAIASGFISHQILDLITTEGIVAFWPISHESIHFSYLSPKHDGWWVMLLCVLISAIFCVVTWKNLM